MSTNARLKAIKLLRSPKTADWSDHRIALHIGCSDTTVAAARHDINHFPEQVEGADGILQAGPKPGGNKSAAARSKRGRRLLRGGYCPSCGHPL